MAIIDWHSRRVLSWRLSNRLDTDFWVEALEEALQCFGEPKIFNTDQGAQFTSEAFTGLLRGHNTNISIDSKTAGWTERLWRTWTARTSTCAPMRAQPNYVLG